MFSWNIFPYSDFNKLNLDWVCRQISACGTFWTCSEASLVIDPDRGTGVSFYMADMTGPAGDAEPKQGDAVFYSLNGITYCAFIDDVVGAGGGNPEFLSFRIYRMTGPQGEPGESGGGGTGLTEDIKQALLQLAQKVAYIDANGSDYYQDLYDALYEVEPPATLVSIDAVYTQSGTVYDTDTLDSLKTDIVVTATYSDSSTAIIPAADYTLSGSLTVGTSMITVSYGGQTDTFNVTVTENPAPPVTLVSIDAVYTQSDTVYDIDTLDSLKTDLVVTANYSDSTTAVIPAADYTLSGTLTVGTSTITVSYGGQTDTFTVTVTDYTILPAGYTGYDFIANTGSLTDSNNDIINTGVNSVYCDTKYIHELTFNYTGSTSGTSNNGIYGCRNASGSAGAANGTTIWAKNGSANADKIAVGYNGIDSGYTIACSWGSKHTLVLDNGDIYVDSSLITTQSSTRVSYTTSSIRLFGVATIESSYSGIHNIMKLYHVKITDSDTNAIIAEFVPCVNSSSIPGVFNLIDRTFHYAVSYSKYTCGNDE